MVETKGRTSGRPMVYLASGSPRRRAILDELDISYEVLSVDTDEIAASAAHETVEENAGRKLLAGLKMVAKGSIVVAADTVLEAQGRLLGKPADEPAAIRYLRTLSGARATAWSAVAVAVAGAAEGCLATETATIHFKVLAPEVIRWYVSTGEPMGRAGAFGIGRLGEVLTESVDGCYSCISGLPKTALMAALASVAGELMPQWLRIVPPTLIDSRVRLRLLTIQPRT